MPGGIELVRLISVDEHILTEGTGLTERVARRKNQLGDLRDLVGVDGFGVVDGD